MFFYLGLDAMERSLLIKIAYISSNKIVVKKTEINNLEIYSMDYYNLALPNLPKWTTLYNHHILMIILQYCTSSTILLI